MNPTSRTVPPLLLFAIGWASLLGGVFGQTLTPDQIEKIEQELNKIQAEVDGERLSTRTSAITAFQKAASSEKAALDFYFACVKEVQFDRQQARSSEFRDWREKNEDRFKDKGNLAALRLQLQYLVLTLRKAEETPVEKLIPEVESLIAGIVANAETLDRGIRLLREPVNQTVFAEVYGLDKTLDMEDWAFAPGNFGAVYEKTVFPYFRDNQPDLLAAAWDRRIKLATDFTAVTQEENLAALEVFKSETLPQFEFDKATDLFQHASQQQGALAILAVLREHPEHPKAGEWLQGFRMLLNETLTAPASTSSTVESQ